MVVSVLDLRAAVVVEVTLQGTVTIILMEVPAVLEGIMDRDQDRGPLLD
jgi:hypothetical protein